MAVAAAAAAVVVDGTRLTWKPWENAPQLAGASGSPSARQSGLDWELGRALQQVSCRLEEKRNFPLERLKTVA